MSSRLLWLALRFAHLAGTLHQPQVRFDEKVSEKPLPSGKTHYIQPNFGAPL